MTAHETSNVIRLRDRKEIQHGKKAQLHDAFHRFYSSMIGLENNLSDLDKADKKSEESDLADLADRRCILEIKPGDFEGRDGFFGYYYQGGELVCVRFCRNIYASHLRCYLDHQDSKNLRIPWKAIRSGAQFQTEVILADYFFARAGSGYMNDWIYMEDKFKANCFAAADRETEEKKAKGR